MSDEAYVARIEALQDELAVAERERDTLRAALIGLKFVTDCWCDNAPDHDYGCRAALAAVSPEGEAS